MSKGTKPDAWMPLFIGDYLAATSRLTTEQHGAYLLLIMDYWRNGPPPADDAVLSQIARLDRKAWAKHRPAIAQFFTEDGGCWRQKRADEEMVAAQDRSNKAAERASSAANARWSKSPRPDAPGNAPRIAPSNAPEKLEECPSPSPVSKKDANASCGRFEEAWKLCTPMMRRRSLSMDKTRPFWIASVAKIDGEDAMIGAVRRYLREDPDVGRTGGPGFHLWLKDETWAHYLPAEPSAVLVVTPEIQAHRQRHYRQTGEWRPTWGDKPEPELRSA